MYSVGPPRDSTFRSPPSELALPAPCPCLVQFLATTTVVEGGLDQYSSVWGIKKISPKAEGRCPWAKAVVALTRPGGLVQGRGGKRRVREAGGKRLIADRQRSTSSPVNHKCNGDIDSILTRYPFINSDKSSRSADDIDGESGLRDCSRPPDTPQPQGPPDHNHPESSTPKLRTGVKETG